MWLVKEGRARSLPLAVLRNRFFAPECVFILGMARASKADARRRAGRPRFPGGREAKAGFSRYPYLRSSLYRCGDAAGFFATAAKPERAARGRARASSS